MLGERLRSTAPIDIDVPISSDDGSDVGLYTRASIYLPEGTTVEAAPVVVAFPGAGYDRRYYDIGVVDGDSYGMAPHLAASGCIVITCDHLGTGESATPPSDQMSLQRMADANAAIVSGALTQLKGQFDRPEWTPSQLIGIGHSMGGCLLTLQQARHGTFDAIALLGWSGVHTVVPVPPPEADIADPPDAYENVPGTEPGYIHWDPRPPALLWAFVMEDTARGALERDVTSRFPACVMTMSEPGIVAAEAASLDVPIFLAFGERDVSLDPYREISAYPRSNDVTLYVLPGAAHCHNFAGSRVDLWNRMLRWMGR